MVRFTVLVLLLITTSRANSCEPGTVAIRYVQAIDEMRWDHMSDLLAEDAKYTDSTMVYYGGEAIEIEGKDKIVEFWKSASTDSGTSDISNTVTACFETGGYHMVNLDILITLAGSFWNVKKDEISIPGKQLMIIRVSEDGRVIEHDDYVGYADGDEFIKEMRAKYGKLDPNR